jgi:hypothetical protein
LIGAALYLHLCALGLRLEPVRVSGNRHGYKVRAHRIDRLRLAERERVGALIRANKPALVALLISGSPAALAVRQEGRYVLPTASPNSRRLMEHGDE